MTLCSRGRGEERLWWAYLGKFIENIFKCNTDNRLFTLVMYCIYGNSLQIWCLVFHIPVMLFVRNKCKGCPVCNQHTNICATTTITCFSISLLLGPFHVAARPKKKRNGALFVMAQHAVG